MKMTTICEHQDREIALHLADASFVGERIKLTADQAKRLAITTIMPMGMSQEDITEWQREFIRFLFKENQIPRRCPECRRRATGELAHR